MNEEMSKIEPSVLMQRAQNGDKEAFGLIYESYFSHIYRYIYFRVQSKAVAEDITQTVFLKVFEKLSSYREKSRPPLAYLFTVARNKVIDYWRKNKQTVQDPEKDLSKIPETVDSAAEIISRTIAMEKISAALENIPGDQRDVIIFKYLNQLSYPEIAKLLKKKEAAIRKLASRGLNSLREYFKGIDLYD